MKATLWALLLAWPVCFFAQNNPANPKILIVVSSYGKEAGKTRPGFEFDEYAQAYLVFKANGFAVEVASPKGGAVEADKYSLKKQYNQTVQDDAEAMRWLRDTKPTASLRAADYVAVYVVGGKGAMFDLPYDAALQDLVQALYAQNSVVAAVCHGPAAFTNVRLADGTFLLAGKKVAGFSNAEETMFGKKWKAEFPFLLEDKLKARGATYTQADVMLPHVVTDGRFLTGQNPYSTLPLVEGMVQALGKTPVVRTPYPDERSMLLVQRALSGEWAWAKKALADRPKEYEPELIAAYGHYRSLLAKEDKAAMRPALDIMELAMPYYQNPMLEVSRAHAYKVLEDKATAKRLLEGVLAKDPTMEEAKKLLAEL